MGREKDRDQNSSYHNIIANGRKIQSLHDELGDLEEVKKELERTDSWYYDPGAGFGYSIDKRYDMGNLGPGNVISGIKTPLILPMMGMFALEISSDQLSQNEFVERYIEEIEKEK